MNINRVQFRFDLLRNFIAIRTKDKITDIINLQIKLLQCTKFDQLQYYDEYKYTKNDNLCKFKNIFKMLLSKIKIFHNK